MVSELKQKLVRSIVDNISKNSIVGVVNMQSLPAQQLQVMRATLRKSGVHIVMARKRLLKLALLESKKENIESLANMMKGMPALLFTKENPFALYSTLQKNKSEAPAKAGQVAPKNIVVKAGPTSFAPGPIISELASVGIKTKVEGGKLAILQDTVVVKEGVAITQKVAETLKRLDIKPMEIGLDLVGVWENGMVFEAKQLFIDESQYSSDLTQAAQWAMNLCVEIVYLTTDTTEIILQKAFRDAKSVGIEAAIMTDETRSEILAKAEREALSVQKQVE